MMIECGKGKGGRWNQAEGEGEGEGKEGSDRGRGSEHKPAWAGDKSGLETRGAHQSRLETYTCCAVRGSGALSGRSFFHN